MKTWCKTGIVRLDSGLFIIDIYIIVLYFLLFVFCSDCNISTCEISLSDAKNERTLTEFVIEDRLFGVSVVSCVSFRLCSTTPKKTQMNNYITGCASWMFVMFKEDLLFSLDIWGFLKKKISLLHNFHVCFILNIGKSKVVWFSLQHG